MSELRGSDSTEQPHEADRPNQADQVARIKDLNAVGDAKAFDPRVRPYDPLEHIRPGDRSHGDSGDGESPAVSRPPGDAPATVERPRLRCLADRVRQMSADRFAEPEPDQPQPSVSAPRRADEPSDVARLAEAVGPRDEPARRSEVEKDIDAPQAKSLPPLEGAENTPVDRHQERPRVEWREGDPPLDPGDVRLRDAVIYVRPERTSESTWDDDDAGRRLGQVEAWPDPADTPEERADKVAEGRARASEALGKENWSNAKFAGEKFYDALSAQLKERFPDGVEFTYEGFPIFERYAAKTVVFEDGFAPAKANGRPDRVADNRKANVIFGWRNDPDDMTWHHKEDGKTMLLLDAKLHDAVRHWGGVRVTKTRRETNDG